jgi:transcriptional regulator with XRE-family HTH domain
VVNLGLVKEKEPLDAILVKIGSKLKQLRVKRGYTSHEDFAYDHDIPRMQYWRIEKGKANLTMKSLSRLLAIHKLTFEEFFIALNKESKSR